MATLLLGDCLEVMKTLTDKSIDCFICDLPYGCLSGGPAIGKSEERARASGSCTWDVKINLAEFWTQVKRLAKNDHTPVLMFCNTKFGFDLYNSNPSWFRYDLVWDKGRGVSFLLASKMPMKSHEMIYIFSKKGTFYNRVDISGDFGPSQGGGKGSICYGIDNTKMRSFKPWKQSSKSRAQSGKYLGLPFGDISGDKIFSGGDGVRCALSVIHAGSHAKSGKHPTEKPLALYKWLLERYCPPGGTVLDPTAGSFNAIIAAEELGLEGIGIEKDKTFYQKAVKKWIDCSDNIIEHV